MSKNKIISYVKWESGSHTPFSGNIYNMLKMSICMGMYATQFFLGNPKSHNRHKASESDIKKSVKLLERFPTHVFSHFPYLSNLAGSVGSLAWNGDKEQDAKTMILIRAVEYELNVLANFHIKRNGVIIHPGNFKDRKKGLKAISESINKIHFTEHSKLVLENSAGAGCSLATTFEEIKEIYDNIIDEKKKYIGVCIDTAHIFGYGSYDLKKCEEIDRLFDDFDRILGLDKFTLLHLNDSCVCMGSKKDRHQNIGDGLIWGVNIESLIYLLNKCEKYGIPSILETTMSDMLTLARLSSNNNT